MSCLNVKLLYLTNREDPFRCYHSGPEWTRERWQWRCTPQSSIITPASSSDYSVSYPRHSAEMKSTWSRLGWEILEMILSNYWMKSSHFARQTMQMNQLIYIYKCWLFLTCLNTWCMVFQYLCFGHEAGHRCGL